MHMQRMHMHRIHPARIHMQRILRHSSIRPAYICICTARIEKPRDRWATLWIFDAFWHVLHFGILLVIAYLWSPNKNNLQYAYMDELGQEEDQEEEEESESNKA
jgi:hypothetical protein